VVRNPVSREDNQVTGDEPSATVSAADFDTLDPSPTDDSGHGGVSQEREPVAQRSTNAEGAVRLLSGQVGDHGGDTGAGMGQGYRGGEADVFGTDDHGASSRVPVVQINGLLEMTGGVDARRTVSRNEPSAARSLSRARGENDGSGGEAFQPCRASGIDR
jgi:hypothetical protein